MPTLKQRSNIGSLDEMLNRLVKHHEHWLEHDKETAQFNYNYLRNRDPQLIYAIDRKIFGLNGLPDAFQLAGINPLCHLSGILYGKKSSLEERKKRFFKILSYLFLEVGGQKELNDSTMNSRRTIVFPSTFLENRIFDVCEQCGCKVLPITFQSIYARGRGLFGNWNAVLDASGFNYKHIRRKKAKYKRTEVIKDLLLFVKKSGYQWSIADIRKHNLALYKGLYNSHSQSPFCFANRPVTETAFIEMQYNLIKSGLHKMSPEDFYLNYVKTEHFKGKIE